MSNKIPNISKNHKHKHKFLTIGIPAYKATETISDLLSSIQIQSIKNEVSIIISPDSDDDYSFTINRYPDLDITILKYKGINVGPGLARQYALDACNTPFIIFADADDIFINPFSLESLKNNITTTCAMVQGLFYKENTSQQITKFTPQNNQDHPWVFGKMYNVKFLRKNKISFSKLKVMEDGEFNWKFNEAIKNSSYNINQTQDPIYLWRIKTKHSITKIGMEKNNGIPLYNYDLCTVGGTVAAINVVSFCKKQNLPYENTTKFIIRYMINCYFDYIECLNRNPIFAEQTFFNAKRFYHSCYKEIENTISKNTLKMAYINQFASKLENLFDALPELTLFQFIEKCAKEKFNGKKEFNEIRSKLPKWVRTIDTKLGVLGKDNYIYTDDELNTQTK